MKHTILLAVVVDDKYSAQDVKKEFEHAASCIDSETFDTVSGIYTCFKDTIAAPTGHTYVLWSEYKSDGCDTYEKLLAYEEKTGYSYSSEVQTSDIQALINAVHNECDIVLHHHQRED